MSRPQNLWARHWRTKRGEAGAECHDSCKKNQEEKPEAKRNKHTPWLHGIFDTSPHKYIYIYIYIYIKNKKSGKFLGRFGLAGGVEATLSFEFL